MSEDKTVLYESVYGHLRMTKYKKDIRIVCYYTTIGGIKWHYLVNYDVNLNQGAWYLHRTKMLYEKG